MFKHASVKIANIFSKCASSTSATSKDTAQIIFQTLLLLLGVVIIHIVVKHNPPDDAVRFEEPKFNILTPYNKPTNIKDNYYNQLFIIKDFRFKINPRICNNETFLLLIFVKTKATNFETRNIIRQTWGRNEDAIKTVFLVGEGNETTNELIEEESLQRKDIVQGNFIDDYKNLTFKSAMGFKWVTTHCPQAKYVLSADDDLVVNIKELVKVIVTELSPFGANNLIACRVIRAPAKRTGKYAAPLDQYPGATYPKFCGGAVALFSQDTVQKILSVIHNLRFLWLEDVFLTGIAAEKVGITRHNIANMILRRGDEELLLADKSYKPRQFVAICSGLTPLKIRKLWQRISGITWN